MRKAALPAVLVATLGFGIASIVGAGPVAAPDATTPTTMATTTTLSLASQYGECVAQNSLLLMEQENLTIDRAIVIAESECSHWVSGEDD